MFFNTIVYDMISIIYLMIISKYHLLLGCICLYVGYMIIATLQLIENTACTQCLFGLFAQLHARLSMRREEPGAKETSPDLLCVQTLLSQMLVS